MHAPGLRSHRPRPSVQALIVAAHVRMESCCDLDYVRGAIWPRSPPVPRPLRDLIVHAHRKWICWQYPKTSLRLASIRSESRFDAVRAPGRVSRWIWLPSATSRGTSRNSALKHRAIPETGRRSASWEYRLSLFRVAERNASRLQSLRLDELQFSPLRQARTFEQSPSLSTEYRLNDDAKFVNQAELYQL